MTHPIRGALLGLLTISLYLLIAFWLFYRFNLWIDITAPLMAAILTFLGASVYSYVAEQKERTRIREMFSHYVPERVVRELVKKPEMLKLGGEKRELTILFSDIEGFTALSEEVAPEDIIVLLNEYMTTMTDIIHEAGADVSFINRFLTGQIKLGVQKVKPVVGHAQFFFHGEQIVPALLCPQMQDTDGLHGRLPLHR